MSRRLALLLALPLLLGQVGVTALGPGQTRIDPEEEGVVAGEVTDARTGLPAADTPVGLYHPRGSTGRTFPEPWVPDVPELDSTPVATVRTASEGQFRFEGLAPGTYRVAPLVGSASTSAEVLVTRDEPSTWAEVQLGVGGRLSGTVLGPDGLPLAQAWVYVAGREERGRNTLRGEPGAQTHTDEAGLFTLDDLPPGRVHLQAARRDLGFTPVMPLDVRGGEELDGLSLRVRDDRDRIRTARDGGGRIGIRPKHDGLGYHVRDVVEGLPAAEAGILPGDRIVAIDGRSTLWMIPAEFLTLARGLPGSEVTLTLSRDGQAPFDVTLLRGARYRRDEP